MAGFSWTGTLNLQVSSASIRGAAQQIQSGLKGVSVPVKVDVDSAGQAAIRDLSSKIASIEKQLSAIAGTSKVATTTMADGFTAVQSSATNATAAVRKTSTSAKQASEDFSYLGYKIGQVTTRLTAFAVATGGILSLGHAFKSAIGSAIDFERQMIRVSQVGVEGQTNIGQLADDIGRIATTWGVSSKALADVTVKFRQAGLAGDELTAALTAVAKADLAPSFGGLEKAAEGLVQIRAQFKLTSSEFESKLGAINSVSNQFAVGASDIVAGLQRSGAAFKAAGGTLEEFVALFTTVRSTTRESADTIASGLKTIFTRLERPAAIENLRRLGIELQVSRQEAEALGNIDLKGTFVGPLEAIRRLSQAMGELRSTDSRFSALAEELGGARQINKIIPLLQEQTKIQQALNVAQAGGIQLSESAGLAQGSLANQASRVSEQFLQLGRNLLNDSGLRSILTTTLSLTSGLISLADAAKPLLPILAALGAVKIASSLSSVVGSAFKGASGGRGFATGGPIPGSGNSDSMVIAATPGEFMIRKSAAKQLGEQKLAYMNQTGRIPGFAKGGPVDYSPGASNTFKPGDLSPTELQQVIPQIEAMGKSLARVSSILTVFADDMSLVVQKVNLLKAKTADFVPGNKQEGVVPLTAQQSKLLAEDNGSLVQQALKRHSGYASVLGQDRAEEIVHDHLLTQAGSYDPSSGKKFGAYFNSGTSQRILGTSLKRAIEARDAGTASGGAEKALQDALKSGNEDEIRRALRATSAGRSAAGSEVLDVELEGKSGSHRATHFTAGEDNESSRKAVILGRLKQTELQAAHAKQVNSQDVAYSVEDALAVASAQQTTPTVGSTRPARRRLGNSALVDQKLAQLAANASTAASPLFVPVPSAPPGSPPRPPASPASSSPDDEPIRKRLYLSALSYLGKSGGSYSSTQKQEKPYQVTFGEKGFDFTRDIFEGGRQNFAFSHSTQDDSGHGRQQFGLESRAFAGQESGFDPFAPRYPAPALIPYRGTRAVVYEPRYNNHRTFDPPAVIPYGGTREVTPHTIKSRPIPRVPEDWHSDPRFRDDIVSAGPLALGGPSEADLARRNLSQADQARQLDERRKIGEAAARRQEERDAALRREAILGGIKRQTRVGVEESLLEPGQLRGTSKILTPANAVSNFATNVFQSAEERAGLVGPPSPPRSRFSLTQDDNVSFRNAKSLGEADTRRQERVDAQVREEVSQQIIRDRYKNIIPREQEEAARTEFSINRRNTIYGPPRPGRYLGQGDDLFTHLYNPNAKLDELIEDKGPSLQEIYASKAIEGKKQRSTLFGGSSVLSDKTNRDVYDSAAAQVNKDLLTVTTRQIQAQIKGVSVTEARSLAEQRIAEAMERGTQVIYRANGEMLGLSTLVEAQRTLGRRDDGRSYLGGKLADLASKVPGFGGLSGLAGGREKLLSGLGNLGVYGGSILGSFISEGINHSAGNATNAIAGGGEGGFIAKKGIAGGLQTGLIGATAGFAVGGAPGAAIGLAVGAIYGFTSALKEAQKEISEAKVGNAVVRFSDRLNSLTNIEAFGGKGASAGAAASAVGEISTIIKENRKLAEADASHFFSGLNPAEYSAGVTKRNRETFGGSITAAYNVLSNSGTEESKKNVKLSLDDLANKVKDGNGGLNKELLSLIANIRSVSLGQVLDEFKNNLKRIRLATLSDTDVKKAQEGEQRNLAAFGRLVTAVETAASSLTDFEQKAKSLSDIFAGSVGASHIDIGGRDIKNFGGNSEAFNSAISNITGQAGEGGARFASGARAANQVAALLPSILSRSLSQGPLDKESYVSSTDRLLREGLGFKADQKLPPELQKAVTTVIGGLQKEGVKLEDIVRATQVDVTKFSESILAPLTDVFKHVGGELASRFQAEANRFVDGLVEVRRQFSVIGEGKDRLAGIQTAGLRSSVGFFNETTGQRHEGVNNLTLGALQFPLQSRQERLSGLVGEAANNPAIIAARLKKVNDDIIKQTAIQQGTGGKDTFEAAAVSLVRLKDQSANLTAAMRHLTDYTERNAAAQEKLASIQRDKESRLGFGERLIGAGDDERSSIDQGLFLANAANNAGSLRPFAQEDQKSIISVLSQLGNTRLTGFQGQPLASDLKENLVKDFLGPLAAQDAGSKKEEADLKRVIAENFARAGEAQQKNIDISSGLQKDFFANLNKSHSEFFTKLASELVNVKKAELTADLGQAGVARGKAAGLVAQKNKLAEFGITTEEQVDTLDKNRGVFSDLNTARKGVAAAIAARQVASQNAAGEITNGKTLLDVGVNDVRKGLLNNDINVNQDKAVDIFNRTRRQTTEQLKAEGFGFSSGEEGRASFTSDRAQEIFKKRLAENTSSLSLNLPELEKPVAAATAKIRALGLNPATIKTGDDEKAIFSAVDALKGLKFDDLDKQLASTTESFKKLEETIRALTPAVAPAAPPAGGFATGGIAGMFPGNPKSSDTVPAWLSPGEMVINASATGKNRSLLEAINSGKSAYMAVGGIAGDDSPYLSEKSYNKFMFPDYDNPYLSGEPYDKFDRHPSGPYHDSPPGLDFTPKGIEPSSAKFFKESSARFYKEKKIRDKELEESLKPKSEFIKAEEPDDYHKKVEKNEFIEAKEPDDYHQKAAREYDPKPPISVDGLVNPFLFGQEQDQGQPARKLHPIEQALLAQSFANPGGASAQFLNPGLGNDAYYGNAAAGLIAQQRAAAFSDPLAAFGLGRAGIGAQIGIGHQSLAGRAFANQRFRNPIFYTDLINRQARAANVQPQRFPQGFATGGMVDGPMGVDQVPAYLSRGEFVMPAGATSRIGASNLRYMADGGGVFGGGNLSGGNNFIGGNLSGGANLGGSGGSASSTGGDITQAMTGFIQASSSLTASFAAFNSGSGALAEAMSKFPSSLALTGQIRHEVVFNGLEMLQRLEGPLKEMVIDAIEQKVKTLLKETLPLA